MLIAALSAELGAIYGDDGSGAFTPADVQTPGSGFVVAWLDGEAVGCGALRPLAPGVAEVKRMYVVPAARGQGIARRILTTLEEMARSLGYGEIHLETGTLQPAAVQLYATAGYARMPCYGIYVGNPDSVCFRKAFGEGGSGGNA